jgi:DNA-binding transcriptional LysR family regulator
MELRELETFVKIASFSSFTKAADDLSLSQPAVTRQIASLERELKTRLLDRLGKKVSLTASGDALYAYASQILRLAGEAKLAVAEASGGESGRLSLGASSTAATYLLPALLAKYRSAHPGVELSMRTGPSRVVEEMVSSNSVDMGIVMEMAVAENIASTQLAEYSYVAVVYPGHHLEREMRGQPVEARSLEGERIVTMQTGATLRYKLEAILGESASKVEIALELDNVEAIKTMVAAKLGVSILPMAAVRVEVQNGALIALELAPADHAREQIALIHRKDKFLSAAMKDMANLLKEDLGAV